MAYLFEVKPRFGDEIRQDNNFSEHTVLDANLQTTLTWLHKTNLDFYINLEKEAESRFGLKSLGGLSETSLEGQPALINLFGVDLNGAAIDRNTLSKGVSLAAFGDYTAQIQEIRRFGILGPKMPYIHPNAYHDELTVHCPSGPIRLSNKRFSDLSSLLPYDGAPTHIVLHEAMPYFPSETHFVPREYLPHESELSAPHYFTGLAGFDKDKTINKSRVAIDLRFPDKVQSAIWSLTDPATGVAFQLESAQQNAKALELDLSQTFFHTTMVKIGVTTVTKEGEQEVSYCLHDPTPSAIVQQEFAGMKGSEVFVKWIITGPRSTELSKGFTLQLRSENESGLTYDAMPTGLRSCLVDKSIPYVEFQTSTPLDLMDSKMTLVHLIPDADPESVFTTSMDYATLRAHVPALAPSLAGLETQVLSKDKAIVHSNDSGLLTVDASIDLKTWTRIQSTLVDGKSPDSVSLPKDEEQLFIRTQLRPISDN